MLPFSAFSRGQSFVNKLRLYSDCIIQKPYYVEITSRHSIRIYVYAIGISRCVTPSLENSKLNLQINRFLEKKNQEKQQCLKCSSKLKWIILLMYLWFYLAHLIKYWIYDSSVELRVILEWHNWMAMKCTL